MNSWRLNADDSESKILQDPAKRGHTYFCEFSSKLLLGAPHKYQRKKKPPHPSNMWRKSKYFKLWQGNSVSLKKTCPQSKLGNQSLNCWDIITFWLTRRKENTQLQSAIVTHLWEGKHLPPAHPTHPVPPKRGDKNGKHMWSSQSRGKISLKVWQS